MKHKTRYSFTLSSLHLSIPLILLFMCLPGPVCYYSGYMVAYANQANYVYSGGTNRVSVTLIPEVSSFTKSGLITVGVHMKIKEGWHVYWRNPGDSGLPTRITWGDHPNLKAGKIQWPGPQRFDENGVTTYGYSDHVTLLVPVSVQHEEDNNEVKKSYEDFEADISWLVCKDICVMESASISLEIDSNGHFTDYEEDALKYIREARNALPYQTDSWSATTRFNGEDFIITLSQESDDARLPEPKGVYFFPYEQGRIDHTAPQKVTGADRKMIISTKASKYLNTVPETMNGVIVAKESWIGNRLFCIMEIQSDVIEVVD